MSGPGERGAARVIISLNAGSSSIKFALYRLEERRLEENWLEEDWLEDWAEAGEPVQAAGGVLEGIGTAPRLRLAVAGGVAPIAREWPDGAALTHEDLLAELCDEVLGHLDVAAIAGIGHRVVHGGGEFDAPVRLDDAVMARLEALCPLAPLHQPHNLAAIRAIRALLPGVPQVACFDTAFHHGMPAVATRLALPRALTDKGIRRYGFHGLSYAYILRCLRAVDGDLARGRVIVAHLGSGASLCAMADGRSIDTTMSFTALDGLMMGTRCGALDPGVVLHLITQEGMSAAQVEHLLYSESGLRGVSGISGDMRVLHASASPAAAEAVELFVWRVAREIGALASSLGGVDGIVFTAGIGENDPVIRAAIGERLGWLGLRMDAAANAVNAPLISAAGSAVVLRVIPTDEERMIALATLATLRA